MLDSPPRPRQQRPLDFLSYHTRADGHPRHGKRRPDPIVDATGVHSAHAYARALVWRPQGSRLGAAHEVRRQRIPTSQGEREMGTSIPRIPGQDQRIYCLLKGCGIMGPE